VFRRRSWTSNYYSANEALCPFAINYTVSKFSVAEAMCSGEWLLQRNPCVLLSRQRCGNTGWFDPLSVRYSANRATDWSAHVWFLKGV